MTNPLLRGEEAVKHTQRILAAAGFYPGAIDGVFGGQMDGGLQRLIAAAHAGAQDAVILPGGGGDPALVWGAKLTRREREKVRFVANDLGAHADHLMRCMAFETGGSFSPAQLNRAGSGATGLIQFMPTTAVGLGTTVAALAKMTVLEQLDYVHRYFRPFRGRLKNLGDFYMAILWPGAVGKPDSHVLWDKATRPTTYRQNSGLDVNKDATITRGEALAKVAAFSAGNPHSWPGA